MTAPVSFEIAKLLKEKGFESMSEPESYYCIKDLGEYYWQKMGGLIVGWEHLDETCSPNHGVPNDYLISAPTIAEVVMWLYEKHGIWVQGPFPYNNAKWEWVIFLLKEPLKDTDGYKNVMSLHHEPYKFNSPEEAYEAAIEYTLNNLLQ